MSASRIIDFFGCKSHPCEMSDKEKYPSELAERFQIRLPAGLRDRIKAYAERHGRSMNTEIVRVLEREFPEQWDVDDRMEHLGEMLAILKAGIADPNIDRYVQEVRETVEGVVTGRVKNVAPEAREQLEILWERFRLREAEDEYEAERDRQSELDPEEYRMLNKTGRTDKLAQPLPARDPSDTDDIPF